MNSFPWGVVLAVFGVVVPIIAFLYEFVLVGRKRLGYRVQMDTIATDEVHSEYAGALQQLRKSGGDPLVDPSFVLLRIENNGATHIDTSDYAVLDDDKVGVRVRFPGRRVAGMVVTELSDGFLRHSFSETSGLNAVDGVIELPKVPMNRAAHYKVLAALERHPDNDNGRSVAFADPEVVGGIKGGAGRGGLQETKSNAGTSLRAVWLVAFLVAVIVAQSIISFGDDKTPLDCAKGKLIITGSTAFSPVLQEATRSYAHSCSGAHFTVDTKGSAEGLQRLKPGGGMLAFSDGVKPDGYPQLIQRPVAFSLFSVVVNKDAGVQDLSLQQIRKIYNGQVSNWQDVGGKDQPVRLVGRYSNSGTRKTFEQRVLGGRREPGDTSDDCREPAAGAQGGVPRCARSSTEDLLDVVAHTQGAMGYAEEGAASSRGDLQLVRIGGHKATLEEADHGAYPFWETEYAYTYGELPSGSLAASFIRYLTNDVGKDIVRAHGPRPCDELRNAYLCQPSK
ncbi:substrate-binding domain-containing protein [Actinomadura barringtoniae]|uniref:Substrate-binding domain-containing protein n=1 Tax=Actinomadura barringtoniae TaxID=1427535 RepID=A0A939PLA7_9ACTN|nr:substrate-binding domain-containing protein [Actinomadura barringtoniae]MBO2451249.1 substrate-binding domain-containing protein [Actinomadura barringtoniae]